MTAKLLADLIRKHGKLHLTVKHASHRDEDRIRLVTSDSCFYRWREAWSVFAASCYTRSLENDGTRLTPTRISRAMFEYDRNWNLRIAAIRAGRTTVWQRPEKRA